MMNEQKHAGATEVQVHINRDNDHLKFLIGDNGRGFDLAATKTALPAERGLGLASIEERVHLLGGVILKVGIEGVMIHTGSVELRPMLADNFDHWMILFGILINAAAPPVSAWLSDAYPRSSPTGSVFLSAFVSAFPGRTATAVTASMAVNSLAIAARSVSAAMALWSRPMPVIHSGWWIPWGRAIPSLPA